MLPLHQWLALSAHDRTEVGSADAQFPVPLPVDWLFSASSEPVLIVATATGRIAQANPAAASLLGRTRDRLIGISLTAAFDGANSPEIRRCMTRAQSAGNSQSAPLRPFAGGKPCRARLSLVRAPPESYLLVRLDSDAAPAQESVPSAVFEAMERASVGFLMAESGLQVEYANQVFVEMVQAESQAVLRGTSLPRWLHFTAADLARLQDQMLDRHAVSLLTTQLFPMRGYPRRVEVCAIPVPEGPSTSWGFTVRELPQLN